jgi:anti-sigma factor RsiW
MTRRDTTVRPPQSCEWFKAQLAPYCASELEPAEGEALEIHLSACAECSAEWQRERHLRSSLGDLSLVTCPDRVTRAILAEIEDVQAPSTRYPNLSRQWTTWSGLVAAAVAVFLLTVNPWSGPVDPKPGPEFSPQEIATARKEARASLALAATILSRTEKSTFQEVFGQTLPESLTRSIKTLMTPPEGGQG